MNVLHERPPFPFKKDASGMSFDQLLRDFFGFLVDHCGEDERDRYLGALESV